MLVYQRVDQGFLSKQFWPIPEWRTADDFPPMKNTQDEPPPVGRRWSKPLQKKKPLDLPQKLSAFPPENSTSGYVKIAMENHYFVWENPLFRLGYFQ